MRQPFEALDCPQPEVTHPVLERTTLVLVSPHYPENVGASARAAKTMGLTHLGLVKPSRLAVPENDMAHKMAVRAWDVLQAARVWDDLDAALAGVDLVFATSSHRGVRGALLPRRATRERYQVAVLFGNEKTGLTAAELRRVHHTIRIPMAGDQPSINLAQAVQIIAYEWFLAALNDRETTRGS